MKRMYCSLGFLAAFMLAFSFNLQAQQNSNSDKKITVIQKVTNDDGSVIVKKKRFNNGDSPEDYFHELKNSGDVNQKMELVLLTEDGDEDEAETMIYIRNGNGQEELTIKGDWDEDEDFDFDFDFDFDDEAHNHHNYHHQKANKALIGIYPETTDGGVLVTSLVYGGGARAAGIEAGDVMTAIDGKTIASNSAMKKVMAEYQPGDVIAVDFLREGQAMTTNVTLTERGKTNKKNPCKVFIGVNLGTSDGAGIRISSTIDNWPAEEMALQSGDRILAMDGVRVEDFDELLVERNKHESGEAFMLTILRGDDTFDVDGQFKECPNEEINQPVPQPEIVPEETLAPPLEFTDNQLKVEGFSAFPNPTAGNLNVRFRGEALPTTITVTDITGQQVYREKLDDFAGDYAKQIDLGKGTPGAMTVTVRQGDKIQSKQVVLLSRA